jgi:acyl dehydratase
MSVSQAVLIDAGRNAAFARLSGDYNPLHVDMVRARRSQFGGCVVHGVHLVLGALEEIGTTECSELVVLDAQFRGAVLVGETVTYSPERLNTRRWNVGVDVSGTTRARVSVELRSCAESAPVAAASPWPEDAALLGIDELAGMRGQDLLALDPDQLVALFPALTLDATDIATLLAVTRIIGMRCPGQQALFRRLRWVRSEADQQCTVVNFHVDSVDARFEMASIGMVAGNRSLRAEVIVRQPPTQQPSPKLVRSRVRPNEFAGQRALVVGGSRGLGELAAKIMIAGGADALVTYHSGIADAGVLVASLGTRARAIQLSVDAPCPESLAEIVAFAPTDVLFFATPPIVRQAPGGWNRDTYLRFIEVYIVGLSRILTELDSTGSVRVVFVPSSTFVIERPPGFSEYVAAKLAAEAFCSTWQQLRPHQVVACDRLPPLVTDQTAAKLGAKTSGNIDALLPVLRRLSHSVEEPEVHA